MSNSYSIGNRKVCPLLNKPNTYAFFPRWHIRNISVRIKIWSESYKWICFCSETWTETQAMATFTQQRHILKFYIRIWTLLLFNYKVRWLKRLMIKVKNSKAPLNSVCKNKVSTETNKTIYKYTVRYYNVILWYDSLCHKTFS